MRDGGDAGPVVVVAHRGDASEALEVSAEVYPGVYRDLVSGEVLELQVGSTIALSPWSLRVLAPAAHPCAG